MERFEVGREYSRDDIEARISMARRDGAFLIGTDAAACLAVLGPADRDPHFPDRGTFQWPSKCPSALLSPKKVIDVFVEVERDTFLYVEASRITSFRKGGEDVRFHLRNRLNPEVWQWLLGLAGRKIESPIEPPETDIAFLTPASSTSDRMQALRGFLARWYRQKPVDSPIALPEGSVPAPLAEFHRLLGVFPKVVVQNHLSPLDKLEAEDGRLVFYVENQAVCVWATESGASDPRVWWRPNERGHDWKQEEEPLSGFLIQLVLFEAIMSAPFGAASTAVSTKILDEMQPLPLGTWLWPAPSTRFFARNGAVAYASPWQGALDFQVGAVDPAALQFLEPFVDDEWNYVAF